MSDITKCEGYDCPKKENCWRYKAPDSPYRQAYFAENPQKDGDCEHYWPMIERKNDI